MNSDDTKLQNLPDPFAAETPCCGETMAPGDFAAELPDPAVLQQELDQLNVESGTITDDLIFTDLAFDELTFQQELELAGLTQPPLTPLEDILSIAERYPGLKVTFSF